jgi:hypothetical protein
LCRQPAGTVAHWLVKRIRQGVKAIAGRTRSRRHASILRHHLAPARRARSTNGSPAGSSPLLDHRLGDGIVVVQEDEVV